MNRLQRYVDAVESEHYEKYAWDHFHQNKKGGWQIWNKWAVRIRFVSTVVKPYLKSKGAI